MSLVLNLAGRQDCSSERLSNKTPKQSSNLKKKKRRGKNQRGRQPGHRSPPSVQETAHGSGTWPKEAGSTLLLEKLTGRERQRGGERETEVAA